MIKKITFKALQPLHLGIGNFGVVAETGIFVMPWQFVAGLGNKQNNFLDIDKNFDEILRKVSVFVPKIVAKRENIKDFRIKNVGTYVSTSVDPSNKGAIDSSLHEIEYLNTGISFVGYVDLDENNKLQIQDKELFIEDGLEFTIGGESKYGFGKVIIENIEYIEGEESENLKLKKVKENDLDLVFPVFLRVYDKEKGFGKKGVYKGFYGIETTLKN